MVKVSVEALSGGLKGGSDRNSWRSGYMMAWPVYPKKKNIHIQF